MNPKCQFCDTEMVDTHFPGYGVTGWECPTCGAEDLQDSAGIASVHGPTKFACTECGEFFEPGDEPDGCRSPTCPMLYGETIGMERLFEQIMEIAK